MKIKFRKLWVKGNWISNDGLYNFINQTQWSKLAVYRLRFFGHTARLDEKGKPEKVALYNKNKTPVKRPQGKPPNTLLSEIKKQLKELDIQEFHQAIILAQDRDNWRNLITRASFQKKM